MTYITPLDYLKAVITPTFPWDDVVDVHLTLICATQLTHSAISGEDAFTLLSIPASVELI
jgi:hypothetical protein